MRPRALPRQLGVVVVAIDGIRHLARVVVQDPVPVGVPGRVGASGTPTGQVYRGVVENALYVTERARGRGVGRALLERLVASTDGGEVWTIVSGIFPENVASIALHESLGFRRVGVPERIGLMQVGPMAGTWRDVVWMERRRPA